MTHVASRLPDTSVTPGDALNAIVARYPQAVVAPDILVLRPDEPLFFANAEPLLGRARQCVRERPGARTVVLSLEESPDLDSTALEALGEFFGWLQAHGRESRVARLRSSTRDALQRAGFAPLRDALDYSSVDDAVQGRPLGANT